MNSIIITIGDEILLGQTIDTNSNYIANQFRKTGIQIKQIISVSDNKDEIKSILNHAVNQSDLIILTGGLGPTKDDITKNTLVEYFNTKLIENKTVKKHIIEFLSVKGINAKDRNIQQAFLPENCTILKNDNGTAPGMWFEKDKKIIVSLPGVPYEMKYIVVNELIPKLKSKIDFKPPIIKNIMTKGLPESVLAEKLSDWEQALPQNFNLAYLPSPEAIKLRISTNDNNNKTQKILDNEIIKLQSILGNYIYSLEEKHLYNHVDELLKNNKLTLSTAESCTGGKIASKITKNPGCSLYFKGSVVAYSNEIKQNILKVDKQNLMNYGAVSKQVVEQMADGVRNLFKTDYAVATSGIAGPDGATNGKPVGTVWIAVSSKHRTVSKNFNFAKLRDINIERSTSEAFNMLRLELIKNK